MGRNAKRGSRERRAKRGATVVIWYRLCGRDGYLFGEKLLLEVVWLEPRLPGAEAEVGEVRRREGKSTEVRSRAQVHMKRVMNR